MEWLSAVREAVDYIEAHLKDDLRPEDAAARVYLSPLHFQRGFQVLTGCSVSEYIRGRRLYLAALDLRKPGAKVIDTALEYGYDTPESFTKAFARFHGVTPLQVKSGAEIRTFLPLTISITVQGGSKMNCKITRMFGFRVIGFPRVFSTETSYAEIPRFWDEICEKYAKNVYAGNPPANACEKAIIDHCIGEFGVCIDDGAAGSGKFTYLVAGRYTGGEVPEGMMLYELPAGEWAVFDCVGPIPEALQAVNTRIFREWLPGNPEYELGGCATAEWYDCVHGEKTDADYRSAIWIPVKRKQ